MAYHVFTAADVEHMLRSSEGEPTAHRGERPGHSGALHLLLTNAELLKRYEDMIRAEEANRQRRREQARARGEKYRPGGPIYRMVTAFAQLPEMIAAGVALLNTRQAQAGITDMFIGSHAGEGTRLEIDYTSPAAVLMRFVSGHHVTTMPVHQLTMILDRVRDRPLGLHVQTFFGGAVLGPGVNRAVLYAQNGAELLGYPGW
ncbi:MAG: hypothetical protein V4653_01440 [Pseudomonadota bacterium]